MINSAIVAQQALVQPPALLPSWTSLASIFGRGGVIDLTSSGITTGNGVFGNWINGLNADGPAHAFDWNSATGAGASWIQFDFGAYPCNVEGFRVYQSDTTTHGGWQFEGSDDAATWTNIHSFTMGGSTTGVEFTFANGTAYRYYRFRHMSGGRSSSPWQREIELYVGYPTGDDTSWTGSVSVGNRSALCTVSLINITVVGSESSWVDGAISNTTYFNNGTGDGSNWILFDFGATPRQIEGVYFNQDVINGHGNWQMEGSDDNATWTVLGNAFPLSGNAYCNFPNPNFYRYYRLRHMSGGRTNAPYIREIEFRSGP